jgi:tetratricopeptide (TPR) repeat protein
MFLQQRATAATRQAGALLVALVLFSSTPLSADRRDQRAADFYSDAVELIEKGDHREAVPLLLKALRRGAREPNESQGSQTRFLVYRYDPYYWLGVALMELGQDDKALLSFEKSDTYSVVSRWPAWSVDLSSRREALETHYPEMTTNPPPAPVCVEPEQERSGDSCLGILLRAFSSQSHATPGQEAYVVGELAFLAGNNEIAVDLFRRAIADDPTEALSRFRYRGLNHEDYLPHFYLGLALAELGQKDAARAALAESKRQITSLHRPAVRRVLERSLQAP